jgi:hypothetical protein
LKSSTSNYANKQATKQQKEGKRTIAIDWQEKEMIECRKN